MTAATAHCRQAEVAAQPRPPPPAAMQRLQLQAQTGRTPTDGPASGTAMATRRTCPSPVSATVQKRRKKRKGTDSPTRTRRPRSPEEAALPRPQERGGRCAAARWLRRLVGDRSARGPSCSRCGGPASQWRAHRPRGPSDCKSAAGMRPSRYRTGPGPRGWPCPMRPNVPSKTPAFESLSRPAWRPPAAVPAPPAAQSRPARRRSR
mmetsp:Transcript_62362/g.201096  ORF Transcript_62362/g.201096 Transcript_62362/m.201096 type:complete len:206 (+) Transcript_62362:2148-2765(+)